MERRFGIIMTEAGKSVVIRIPPRSTAEQRLSAYIVHAENFVEIALFSKDKDNSIIPESITPVPEATRINTLRYV